MICYSCFSCRKTLLLSSEKNELFEHEDNKKKSTAAIYSEDTDGHLHVGVTPRNCSASVRLYKFIVVPTTVPRCLAIALWAFRYIDQFFFFLDDIQFRRWT